MHGELFNSFFLLEHIHEVNTQNGQELTRMCVMLCGTRRRICCFTKEKKNGEKETKTYEGFFLPPFVKVVNSTWLSFSEAIWQVWWFDLVNWKTRKWSIACILAKRDWICKWPRALAKAWRYRRVRGEHDHCCADNRYQLVAVSQIKQVNLCDTLH